MNPEQQREKLEKLKQGILGIEQLLEKENWRGPKKSGFYKKDLRKFLNRLKDLYQSELERAYNETWIVKQILTYDLLKLEEVCRELKEKYDLAQSIVISLGKDLQNWKHFANRMNQSYINSQLEIDKLKNKIKELELQLKPLQKAVGDFVGKVEQFLRYPYARIST